MIGYLGVRKISEQCEARLSSVVDEVVKSGTYLYGERVAAFERGFADYCGVKHCVGVANGLDALTLILMAYKRINHWSDGDEVIVSANTFAASFLAVLRAGLKPVACDVNEDDYLMDASLLESLLTPRTRAVMPVHIYGALCDMPHILAFAHAHGLKVVEDAAQAHGATDAEGRRAGSLGDAAGFSFYPAKNLGALSDAGAVTTNDDELAAMVRVMANYGSEKKYYHTEAGINSRIDELQAAVLSLKLGYLDRVNARKQQIAARYSREITNPIVATPYRGKACHSVYHVYPVFCDRRDELQEYLLQRGVKTIIHYPIPPHAQPALGQVLSGANAPHTESVCRRELSLPSNTALTEDEVSTIINLINDFR